jgi:hypothetical protein
MSKKILFCSLFILIILIPSKKDLNAKTWERHNTTVSAESIIAAIDRGDSIVIDSCKIFDALIGRGTTAPDTIWGSIEIHNSTFSDSVFFEYCYFMKPISFYKAKFLGGASFWQSTFDTTAFADFYLTTFGGEADFSQADFLGGASFWGATFDTTAFADFCLTIFGGEAHFSEAKFRGGASFWGATFDTTAFARFLLTTFGGKANFMEADFHGGASFRRATFDTTAFADFYFTTFGGEVDFEEVDFHGGASFRRATFDTTAFASFLLTTFGGKANFMGAEFHGGASFWRATFDTTAFANFYFTTFGGEANFRGADFRGGASFWGATFDTSTYFDSTTFGEEASFLVAEFRGGASFWGATFDNKVNLSSVEFKEIYIRWNQLEGRLICDNETSYKLMKHFEGKRMLDDADGIFLFLKNQERMEKSPWIRYPEYWFVYLTCGYGRRPLNTFILSIVLVILFAILFTNSKAIKEIERDFRYRRRPRIFREIPKSWTKRFYYALYFSLHTFIIGVVSDWHATDEFLINTKTIKRFRFRTLSMIEGALGWILVIILIISLERTIGR